MAWRDLPPECAEADAPLTSWLLRTVQGRLDRCYDMTVDDRPVADAEAFEWESTSDEWQYVTSWVPMPVRVRKTRAGSLCPQRITVRARGTVSDFDVRVYLLDSPTGFYDWMLDPVDVIPGVDAFGEFTTTGPYADFTLDIQTQFVQTIPAMAAYDVAAMDYAWLHVFAKCALTARKLEFHVSRVRELLEIV